MQEMFGKHVEKVTAFALLSGSIPLSVFQAKIMLIHLKDNELTFYSEVTLENWICSQI